jgi:hypothetical protein
LTGEFSENLFSFLTHASGIAERDLVWVKYKKENDYQDAVFAPAIGYYVPAMYSTRSHLRYSFNGNFI